MDERLNQPEVLKYDPTLPATTERVALTADGVVCPRRLVLERLPFVMLMGVSPLRGPRVLSTVILTVLPFACRAAVMSNRFWVAVVMSLVCCLAIVP